MFNHDIAAKDGFVLHNGTKLEYLGFDACGNAVVKNTNGVIITFRKNMCRNIPKEKETKKFITCTDDEIKDGDTLLSDYGIMPYSKQFLAVLKQGVLRTVPQHGGAEVYHHDPVEFSGNNAFVKPPMTREDYIKCVNAKFQYKEISSEEDGLIPITLSPRDWSVIKYIITLAGENRNGEDGPLSAVDWLFEKLDGAGVPDINYNPEEDISLVRKTWPKEALELKA